MSIRRRSPPEKGLLDKWYSQQRLLLGGKTASRVLQEAKGLILDRDYWLQTITAANAQGKHTKPRDPDTVAWSLDGAICFSCNNLGIAPPGLLQFLDQFVVGFCARRGLFNVPVPAEDAEDDNDASLPPLSYFADCAKHEDVLAFLDEASAALQREGK